MIYKSSCFHLLNDDNYLLYLKGLRYDKSSERLLTHKEMYRSHIKRGLAIPLSSVKEKLE
jgi:hypothetical protein